MMTAGILYVSIVGSGLVAVVGCATDVFRRSNGDPTVSVVASKLNTVAEYMGGQTALAEH